MRYFVNKNNHFFRFFLFIILGLSIGIHSTLFGMEQHSQEETNQNAIQNSGEQSIVALNVLVENPNENGLFAENPTISNPTELEEKLLFVLERSSAINKLESNTQRKLSNLTATILRKAHELYQQGFFSFYHTRSVDWDFFSHIVKVCEEKKKGNPFSDDTNFFAYNPETSKKILVAQEADNDKNKHLFEGENNSYYGDGNHLKFPIRWLMSRLGESHPASRNSAISASLFIMSSQPNESALHLFANNFWHQNKADILQYDLVQKNFLELLKRYEITDKSEALKNLYQKTFGTSYNTLYHIAIHKDLLDRCVLLTKEYAQALEYCKGKLTTDLFAQMNTEQGHQELSTNFVNQEPDRRNLIGVQARIFIDTDIFTNPELVKAYAHYQDNFGSEDQQTSFDQESQTQYWQELREICNGS